MHTNKDNNENFNNNFAKASSINNSEFEVAYYITSMNEAYQQECLYNTLRGD